MSKNDSQDSIYTYRVTVDSYGCIRGVDLCKPIETAEVEELYISIRLLRLLRKVNVFTAKTPFLCASTNISST